MDILLIAGLWLDGSAWDGVASALEPLGHRPVPLTLPGQGDGSASATLDDQVAAVLAGADPRGRGGRRLTGRRRTLYCQLVEDLEALALLTDPVRRSAYQVVVKAGAEPVGRDEVATALGIGRTLAAFHLDKLVDVGLLEVSYARRTGRSGPGAGRPAKLYRRASGERVVSVPPRSYLSAAEVLAEGIERAGADAAVYDVARQHGRDAGAAAGAGADPVEVLAARGYEPAAVDSLVRLRNCPFHQLAQRFPPLVCGMNLALVEGVLDGAGAAAGWSARLDPAPGHCCVALSKNKSDDL